MAIEIVDLPLRNCDFPILVYQRVLGKLAIVSMYLGMIHGIVEYFAWGKIHVGFIWLSN